MNIYTFTVKDGEDKDVSLEKYKDKVLLVVNTATKCGLTPQYEGLEALYQKYKAEGFEILDFPCNQFMGQAPGSFEEITTFCTLNYGTTFPRFKKIEINGMNTVPLYKWLKEQGKEDEHHGEAKGFIQKLRDLGHKIDGNDIKWNFTKFLIDRDGQVVARYGPTWKPEELEGDIEKLLWPEEEEVCSAEFTEGCK